ncbi:bifunctional molybdenum cofactor biosynthesis protein MoaC/MoaB [Leeuwenhoekiella palythoae]|uniref:Cyclic pyranopterin monophosphate synthase subunit MoaC n=1 Tax=Leeuwenhoekiella palythoae TaxID=573501 RepID=A0A1M5XSQ1_9FLAO|nr:bifunctional molybdenum cofactor biosynthesis protein MoaC/MoaB [Leeuwenhoekiella palythoae]RXG30237.1 cyclic pyranopterin monophosphate synthase subunit MoaC [Leeuwenhoekiella palythoae]SHI02806.1 cyclic pyranopterin monophosphate synthase subunit MoaC [Leeuwenhoekiella palythoae]
MVDITHKINTLRSATAQATVCVSKQETIDALQRNAVPKGNVFEMAKTAGLFAVKNTHTSIPDCHPLPVEYTAVDYRIEGLQVFIVITVKTVYKTGVEVEAMHGASVIALTMYDMLKPIDKGIEINNVKLLHKKGGKSSFKDQNPSRLSAHVIVCSDSISEGKKEDRAGKAIMEKLQASDVQIQGYEIIPDDLQTIRNKALELSEVVNLLIYTGGTGLSIRDVTPEALEPILERRIPGVEEAIRKYGQDRMPYAMLSRSVVGTLGNCLVLALPGSTNGAKESMDAVFPHLLHVFKILRGAQHQANE